MPHDEDHFRANVQARSERLFDDGYRAKYHDPACIIVINPRGIRYTVNPLCKTCTCPFFAEWKEQLSREEYKVLRKAGTERPFTGEYTNTKTTGIYRCRACSAELFRSDTKFDSHCGWPSFFAPLAEDRVEYIEDRSFGSVRTEVRCANCGSHLGHVFEGEGFPTPTDQRYCINGVSMRQRAD